MLCYTQHKKILSHWYLDVSAQCIYYTVHCCADRTSGTIYYSTYSAYQTIDENPPRRHCWKVEETI